MIVKDILEIFYAPQRAFKRIIQKPRYIGPLLVIVLFVAAQTAFYYTYDSKLYPQPVLPIGPLGDTWTENATLWQSGSGMAITNDYFDFINATPVLTPYFLASETITEIAASSSK